MRNNNPTVKTSLRTTQSSTAAIATINSVRSNNSPYDRAAASHTPLVSKHVHLFRRQREGGGNRANVALLRPRRAPFCTTARSASRLTDRLTNTPHRQSPDDPLCTSSGSSSCPTGEPLSAAAESARDGPPVLTVLFDYRAPYDHVIDDRCPDENNYVPTTVKSRRPAAGVTCSNNCFRASSRAVRNRLPRAAADG